MSVSFFPFLKRLFILLSIPLLFLSACSQPLSLLKTSNTPHLLWTAPIGGSSDLLGLSVVIANGMAYYNGDKLYAFDATTGRQKWTALNTSGLNIPYFPPVVTNGVILNFVDNKLRAFDAATGQLKWSNNAIVNKFVAANGVVYAIEKDSRKISAFDATTGQLKWTAFLGNEPESGVAEIADHVTAITNGVVYVNNVGPVAAQLYTFDAATGQHKWATRPFSINSLDPPVVAGSMVYFNSDKLYAFDAAAGQLKWTASAGSHSPVAVVNGVVYAVDDTKDNEKLDAFDAATGQLKWAVPIPTPYYGIIGSPVVANGVVYAIYDHDYNLYAYDAATGQQKWITPIDDAPLRPSNGPNGLAVANGIAYVAIPDTNKLYAFSLN